MLGPEHPDVATSLSNIADVLVNREQYAQAKPLYERALSIRQKVVGPDSTAVAGTLGSLCWVSVEQSQFAEAEPPARRALAIYEREYGPDHRFLTSPLESVALAAFGQGRLAESDQLLRRALANDRKQKLEGSSTEAASVLAKGDQLFVVREDAAAKAQYFRALALYGNALGPDDPHVRTCLEKVAAVYDRQKKPLLAGFFRRRAAIAAETPAR